MSLVQQRISIQRGRVFSIVLCVVGVLGLILGISLIAIGGEASAPTSATFAGVTVLGIALRIRASRRLSNFEREHGVDAGRQEPVN